MNFSSDLPSDSTSGTKGKIQEPDSPQRTEVTIDPAVQPSESHITWVSVHHRVNELEHFHILLPEIAVISTLVPDRFHITDLDFFTFNRPSSTTLLSIARLQYSEWVRTMSPDAELSAHQIDIVAQYVNLLYMETFQILKDIYSQDLQVFVEAIAAQHNAFVLDKDAPHLQEYYNTIDTDAWGNLTSRTSDILAYLESDASLDTFSYTDTLLNFAHCIETDLALTASLRMQVNQDTPYLTAAKTPQVNFMKSNSILGKPEMRGSRICGFENRSHLIQVYETYYGRHDTTIDISDPKQDSTPMDIPSALTKYSHSPSLAPNTERHPKTRVSNYTSRPLPSRPVTPAPTPTSSSTALTPVRPRHVSLHSAPPPPADNSLVLHQGRTINIVELVQQLVHEQIAPLRQEFTSQENVKHINTETLQEARTHHVILTTLTGEEAKDF